MLAVPVGTAVVLGAGPISDTLGLGTPAVGLPGLGRGLPAIYAAILGDMYGRAIVNLLRYWSDARKDVAAASDVGATAD